MIGLQKLDKNRRFFVVCLLGIKVDLYKCHYKLEISSSYALTLTIVCMIVVRKLLEIGNFLEYCPVRCEVVCINCYYK